MRSLKIFVVLLFVSSTQLSAQISFESYLSDSFNQTLPIIKEKLVDQKYEEKEVKNLITLTYYTWIDPFSIRIQYIFTKEGTLLTKTLTNAKENVNDAEKLFDILKELLFKNNGTTYTDNSMLGVKMLIWKSVDNLSIMLVRKGDQSMLKIIRI